MVVNGGKNMAWINNVKAICMIFVYISHCEVYAQGSFFNVRPFYRLFYVNAFFLISGYLFFRKQLTAPLIEETRTEYEKGGGRMAFYNAVFRILIPTIVFGLLLFFPKIFVRRLGFDIDYFVRDVLLGGFAWFTATLFVSEFVLILLLFTRVKNIFLYLIATLLFCAIIVNVPHSSNYIWCYQSGIAGTIILALGGLFWRYESSFDSFFYHWGVIILLFVVSVVIFYFINWKMECTISSLSFTPIGIIAALLVCIFVIYFSKIIGRLPIFDFIGKNSLVFYMFSGAFPNVIAVLLSRFINNTTVNVVLTTFFSLVLATASTWIVNKYFPFLTDLRKIRKLN